jgi:tetratricopeptide (TPR) repeat protein
MEIFEQAKEDSSSSGLLEINSEPAQAEVYLNGEFTGLTPFRKEIIFGRYYLEIRLFGYETYSKTFILNSEEMSLGKMALAETYFYTRFKEAMAFYENGDYDTALDIFFDVIVESREFPHAYIMIGLCYSKIPEMEYEGISWIKNGLSKSPEKMKGYKSLFEIYWNIEDYKAALSTLKEIENLENSNEIRDWIKTQKLNLEKLGYK